MLLSDPHTKLTYLTMNGRPAPPPMSPLSFNSNDSFASRYGSLGAVPSDTPPYAGGPYGVRPPQTSPPGSNHPSSGTDMSRPSAGSGSSFTRPPSSASSVGRSNDGRMGFGGPASRDSGRSHMKLDSEDALQRHYHVLKGYLASSLRDEKGNIKPNKARDKLLRLSVTQFMELSTDVYDELLRREDDRIGRVQNVPASLPPKQNFHPKRNQARQKLSTLPVERFRQLATDVFYELERRIPRFVGTDIDRPSSSASSNRAPSRNGIRPPPGGYRGPPPGAGPRPPMGPNGMGPPQAPYQSFRPASPGMNGPAPSTSPGTRPPTGGSDNSNFGGRPLPKTFQSNTIVPNKSTMVEEDEIDEDDNESAFGLDKPLSGNSSERFSKSTGSGAGVAEDKEKIRVQETEIAELKEKLETLQGNLLGKEGELQRLEASGLDKEHELESLKGTLLEKEQELKELRSSGQDREEGLGAERSGWYDLREELEQKHLDAQKLNEDLQRELDQLAISKSQDERDIRAQHVQELEELQAQLRSSHRLTIGDLQAQLDDVHDQSGDVHRQLQAHQAENELLRQQLQSAQQTQHSVGNSDYERRIELLEQELLTQEKLTNEVREEAMMYLQEMRDLSRQNDYAIEQEEKLAARVVLLETKNEEWRQRYAKIKAQNKSLRASTMGLDLQTSFDSGSLIRKEDIISDGGLVRDVDVTHFQVAIDELLKVARQPNTGPMLDGVKNVVMSVQSITSAVGTDGYPTPSPSPLSPLDGLQQHQPIDSVARLKARVTGTANSLITATKQHASASGLSPVALLDAAASNLTAAVVELIKAVGIRSSLRSELRSEIDEDESEQTEHAGNDIMASFYNDRLSTTDRSPAMVAAHSPSPSVQVSSLPEPKPAPLNLGRSNTTKKTNGWFGGWGKKSSVDETVAMASSEAESDDRAEDYDPYR